MTTFFLDLWQDLREKRLWPVAVGLLAATAAIPFVLLKPASETPAEPTVVAAKPQANAMPVVIVDDSPTRGSKLETFSERNPFKPLADLDSGKTGPAGSPTGGSGGGGSTPSSSAKSAGGTSVSGGSGGGSKSSGGSGGGSSPNGVDPNGPRVQWFRYTADIEFGAPGEEKKLENVKALSLLPDEKTPVVVFMGVSDDAKSAMFFVVDPAFKAEGEGDCNDADKCTFVSLRLSDSKNEETFTSSDGNTVYDLKLLKLNRENITASEAAGDSTDESKAKKSGTDGVREATEDIVPKLLSLPGIGARQK